MIKRILLLLLALVMLVSVMPVATYADDGSELPGTNTEEPKDPTTEVPIDPLSDTETGDPCPTCGLEDCTSTHETWCYLCLKDDCGVTHIWCPECEKMDCGVNHGACPTCGQTGCSSDHANWCADCGMDNCGRIHVWCDTCKKNDCGLYHVWCDECEKMDCGVTHKVMLGNTSSYSVNIGKNAKFNPLYINGGTFPISDDPKTVTDIFGGDQLVGSDVSAELVVVIQDVYDDGTNYWYKVSAADGYTLPAALLAKPWVYQNNVVGGSADADSLLIQEEPVPDEPENPCACCDACTGAENCTCECDSCTFKPVTEPVCDCNIKNDVQFHANDCPLYLHWVEIYVEQKSVEEIADEWRTLGVNTRKSIQAILEEEAPEKMAELKALLPDMNVTKQDTVVNTQVTVYGDIPTDVSLKLAPVSSANFNDAIYNYISADSRVVFAFDVSLYNPDNSKWQPYDGDKVTVSLDAASLELSDGARMRLLHDHEGSIEDLGSYTVTDGYLSFEMGKFSTVYVVPLTAVVENAFNNVVYFDLNAGKITINGSSYTGYRFDGGTTALEVNGTLKAGQSYYVYQSNENNKSQTGLFNTGTAEAPVYEIRLPQYERVKTSDGKAWTAFIENNYNVEGVIDAWVNADKDDRTATPNWINVKVENGVVNAEMVIDNIWSSYSDHGATRDSGAIAFQPGASNNSSLTLVLRGDNRVECVHYWANKGRNNQLIFEDYDSKSKNSITAADLDMGVSGGQTGNYWMSAIGGDDGSHGNADGIIINSGVIYAGTTAADDCTAIGGGGNDYGGVTINGGVVTAVTSSSGTAIGGGIGKTSHGGQADVTINNGRVYAYNFSCSSRNYSQTGVSYIPAAAIGGGSSARQTCNPCTVTITGGYVFARSVGGTALGGGSSADTDGGASAVNISGGEVDIASVAGEVAGNPVKAGVSIGGGTGGTNGNGGDCTLNISGSPTIRTGSIGGGKTLSTDSKNTIGAATVKIEGGTLQGQVIMAKGAASDCSFNMTGGTIDNTAALSATKNADGDWEFINGSSNFNKYTFLEENGGAVYVENGKATLGGGTVKSVKATNGGAFYVTGGEFEMTGGTIQDFTATNGGAVCVMAGTAKVGGTITGSASRTEAEKGGAVYVGGGSFEMTGGNIENCNASVMGGAVCAEKVGETIGEAKVSAGTISNVYAPKGGAVAVSGGEFEMASGTITGVKAINNGSTNADGDGGAVYVDKGSAKVSGGDITGHETEPEAKNGGGVYVKDGTFEMTDGTMKNFNVTGNGGMVYVTGAGAKATVQGGTILGNNAADVNEAAKGGAVYISGGEFIINGAGVIKECNATADGGGVYLDDGKFTAQDGSFENCSAAKSGGGVYMGSGTFDMDGGEFVSCTAEEYGGGVYLGGGTFDLGGKGKFTSCTASKYGGGVYLANGTFKMPGGSVMSCSAENGGGVYLAGGIFEMDGGTFEACHVTENGGAVCVMNGTANIKGGKIQGDNTVADNKITVNEPEAKNGGGIYVGGGKLNMENGEITRCSADNGGAAYITAGECYMKGGKVSYNHAVNGGAMYVNNTHVTYGGLHELTVEWNVATNNGGGMYIENDGKDTEINSGIIQNNTATNFGGGIYHTGDNGTCTVKGSGQIKANIAKNGGGLYIIGGSMLTVNGGHITENRAIGRPDDTIKTAYDHENNVGVGGGVYVGPSMTVNCSNFTMVTGKSAGIYDNYAEFAADDLYANIKSTVLSLPNVDGMNLGATKKATGWFCDYAKGDTHFAENTLLDTTKFELDTVTSGDIERYRDSAQYSDTTPYKVDQSLEQVTGKYVCLTIGSEIINFGKIVISKTGSVAEDQYFVFKVEAVELKNESLDKPVFEVTIKGNGSVTIDRVPFGRYTVSEVEAWSWRYSCTDGSEKAVEVDSSEEDTNVSFVNQLDTSVAYDNDRQSELWLDGNSNHKLNIYGTSQAGTKNVLAMLGNLFTGKGAAA